VTSFRRIGGTRTAAINGGYVALALALQRLRKDGAFAALPLADSVLRERRGWWVDGSPRLSVRGGLARFGGP
jgi:hypothetical protein